MNGLLIDVDVASTPRARISPFADALAVPSSPNHLWARHHESDSPREHQGRRIEFPPAMIRSRMATTSICSALSSLGPSKLRCPAAASSMTPKASFSLIILRSPIANRSDSQIDSAARPEATPPISLELAIDTRSFYDY